MTEQNTTDTAPLFDSERLLQWFSTAQRPLPWRKTYAPYAVWISEIMLQQTQMERAVTYFLAWMKQFPDIASVANAPEDVLVKAWEGLGYYRRVRNLQAAARIIMQEHGGIFPQQYEHIKKLPGIGEYTAGAIASIAFNENIPAIDANVERVFARFYDIDTPIKERQTALRIRTLVTEALPHGQARAFNQALMELGALLCKKRPLCTHCPLGSRCESYRLGIPEERPVPMPKKPIVALEVATGVLMHEERIYVQRRPNVGLWAGFWELPGGKIEKGENSTQAIVREFAEETGFTVIPQDKLAIIKHGYTTYRVTLHCHLLALDTSVSPPPYAPQITAATAYKWVTWDELNALTLPAGHRKLVDTLHHDIRFSR